MRKSLFVTVSICFALTFGMAGPALAQRTCNPAHLGEMCPVTGTAGFETGLGDLAFLEIATDLLTGGTFPTGIDWGDGGKSDGLIRCFEPGLHPKQCHVFGTHAYATPEPYPISGLLQTGAAKLLVRNTSADESRK
jgi:hypothetical protein